MTIVMNDMKANYICANFDCNYTTGRNDNLPLKDLKEVVKKDGGMIEGSNSTCPSCHQNSLVYSN
jgi:hypothetical protein